MKAALGIDLGGTYARAALVSGRGEVLAAAKTALSDRRVEAVVEAIGDAATQVMAGAQLAPPDLLGVGVGVAGQLATDDGLVAVAPNLGWRDAPFGRLLAAKLGRRVRVVNDLSAAAWGELHVGAAKGQRDLFVTFVGSGVGGCLVVNGALVNGATGVAGEFGHVKVVPGGRRCGCGERGCLEAYVGGHNLILQMRELLESGAPTRLRDWVDAGAELTPVLLERAVAEGDAAAQALYDRVAGFLGLAVANQVTVLNPGMLLLGGGVLSRCPGLRARVEADVRTYASAVSRARLQIADASLGDDSGLVGAALLALAP